MVSCGQVMNLPPTTPTSPTASSLVGSEDRTDAGGGQSSHSPERQSGDLPVSPSSSAPSSSSSSLQQVRGLPPPTLRGVTRSPVRPSLPPPGPGMELGGPGASGFIRPAQSQWPLRPPFFIREIYKNGFLKRLPYNEKKSSALAKLMKSDRYWVVFSIHDDVHPFLELWHEPTEVASKPPQYIFPLVACQHISPSIIPADSEWSFVINFDTVAIRFSCNSRDVMEDWVEVIRNKLGEMGILNPKGNLYSRTPLGPPVTKPVIRDPTSPLPQPPPPSSSEVATSPDLEVATTATTGGGSKPRRGSVIDSSPGQSQTFTTSIYLNQPAPKSPNKTSQPSQSSQAGQLIVNRKSSLPVSLQAKLSGSQSELDQPEPSVTSAVAISSGAAQLSVATGAGAGATSSVYLNQSSPTRHVTVIPINNMKDPLEEATNTLAVTSISEEAGGGGEEEMSESVDYENHTYGAIFDFDEKTLGSPSRGEKEKSRAGVRSGSPRKEGGGKEGSPRRGRERERARQVARPEEPPPLPDRPVLRRLSERRKELLEGRTANIQQKIRRKSRRSSSLGPLLDGNILAGGELGASTLSLESVDSNSNPRQAALKSDRSLGAIPRRHLQPPPRHGEGGEAAAPNLGSHGEPRNINELPPGVRPPPYHPLASINHPSHPPPAGAAFPPMIPLPGLTCQLSMPPGLSLPPVTPEERGAARSHREQQVVRLRQEISHPAGVRLQLRKKDVQSSLALVDLFGCVWVVGWKQRDYPVLYNAFHIGDQIISVSGVLIRSSGEFSKLVKLKSADLHTEIIIRRAPFGQVFYLKPDIEGQSLGIILNNSTAEIKEIIPGSVASQTGVSAKVRSLDGQSVVPLVITEINARPLNLFFKDGETWERLSGISRDPSRDISVLLQPADIVAKLKKQLKSLRGYKDFLLG